MPLTASAAPPGASAPLGALGASGVSGVLGALGLLAGRATAKSLRGAPLATSTPNPSALEEDPESLAVGVEAAVLVGMSLEESVVEVEFSEEPSGAKRTLLTRPRAPSSQPQSSSVSVGAAESDVPVIVALVVVLLMVVSSSAESLSSAAPLLPAEMSTSTELPVLASSELLVSWRLRGRAGIPVGLEGALGADGVLGDAGAFGAEGAAGMLCLLIFSGTDIAGVAAAAGLELPDTVTVSIDTVIVSVVVVVDVVEVIEEVVVGVLVVDPEDTGIPGRPVGS